MDTDVHLERPKLLSKQRFLDIKQFIIQHVGENEVSNKILHHICNIMNFNPEHGLYMPEYKKALYQKSKEKAAELGISVYALTGKDTYYQNNKEKLNKARAECLRKQRLRNKQLENSVHLQELSIQD